MSKLKNQVLYSATRDYTLQRCPRQYFYKYYASWEGWEYGGKPPRSKRARQAYIQKHAYSRFGAVGVIIHETIEEAIDYFLTNYEKHIADGGTLESYRDKLEETDQNLVTGFVERCHRKMKNFISQARRREYEKDPKRVPHLVEFDFDLQFDEDELLELCTEKAKAVISPASSWSVGANLFHRILRSPHRVVTLEKMYKQSIGEQGIMSWLSPDVVLQSKGENHGCVVIDWKTADFSKEKLATDARQMSVYSTILHQEGWDEVITMLVYFENSGSVKVVMRDDDPDVFTSEADGLVSDFLSSLADRLVGGDLERNKPIPSSFEPTNDPENCVLCPFQRLCESDGWIPEDGLEYITKAQRKQLAIPF